VIGRTLWSNIGRTLCVSQSFSAVRRGVRSRARPKPDLGKRDHTDKKLVQRTIGYKGHNPRFRPWPAQLGQDVGIE
jgi:hypothetical protein